MALKDVVKVSRKTFFNPSAWIGYDQLKSTTSSIWEIIKTLIVPAKAGRKESFEHAMNRMGLTEHDIKEKKQIYLTYAYGFVILAGCSLITGFYLLFHHKTLSGWLLGIAVTALFLSQAFRYHFWYFQIKHRKLGCTFSEWRQGKINHHEKPKP